MTGPILDRTDFKTIGSNKVAVPNDFYKIAVFCDNGKITDAFAVIMSQTNKLQSTAKGLTFDNVKFIVSIDDIERRTGLDFFPTLKDDVEDALESHKYGETIALMESFELDGEKETTTDPAPVEPTPDTPVIDNPETPSEPIVDNTTDDTTKKDTPTVEDANKVETVLTNIEIIENTGNLRKFVLNKRFITNIARTFKTDNYSVLYNIGLNGLEDKIVGYHIDGKTKLTYKTIDDPNDNQDDTLAVSSDIKANNGTTLEEFAEIYGTTVENFVIYLGTIKAKDLVK